MTNILVLLCDALMVLNGGINYCELSEVGTRLLLQAINSVRVILRIQRNFFGNLDP